MHILSPIFLDRFKGILGMINLHPALPGEFDGVHSIARAFQAHLEGKITETGVMVHRVIIELDKGEVIVVEKVPILKEDSIENLEDRMRVVEHRLIVRALEILLGKSKDKLMMKETEIRMNISHVIVISCYKNLFILYRSTWS